MKRYKISISQEVSNGSKALFFGRAKEEVIFEIMLPAEEIDIGAVMKQIVAGKIGRKG